MRSHHISKGVVEIASPGARYLRLQSAIEYFEMTLGELRKAVRDGVIPGFKFMGRIYVDIRDIDTYVDRMKAERARDIKQTQDLEL